MGEVYTDFDMETVETTPTVNRGSGRDGKVYRVEVETWIAGNLNGGGIELKCKTFNGDIIIRKK